MKVEFFQSKPHCMCQMYKLLIQLQGMDLASCYKNFLVLCFDTFLPILTNNHISCSKPCKVGVKYLEDGTKVRVSRGIGASGTIIPRPEILKMRSTPRPTARKYLIHSSLISFLLLICGIFMELPSIYSIALFRISKTACFIVTLFDTHLVRKIICCHTFV